MVQGGRADVPCNHADGVHALCYYGLLERLTPHPLHHVLQTYLQYVQATTPLTSVRLICKQALIPLYEMAGFELVGPSSVMHGQDPWFECAYMIDQDD